MSETSIDMKRNSQRAETVLVVSTHVAQLILLFIAVIYVVPIFGEPYLNGGSLPGPTQFMFDISDFCRIWLLLLLPIIVISVYLDAKLYSFLSQHGSRIRLLLFMLGVVLFLSVLQLIVLWTMSLPIFMMGEVVSP